MAIKLSHAKANELGTTSGGQVGDQLGGNINPSIPSLGPLEVVTEDWYNNSSNPWTHVLRPPTDNFGIAMAQLAIQIVANNNVGYDQPTRNTLLQQLQIHNWDASSVGLCSCDCSSFIRCCCIYAGRDPGDIYTANMISALTAIGFTDYTGSQYVSVPDNLKTGDVLLKNGHTALVTGQGLDVWMRWTFYESGKPYNSVEALSIMGGTGNGGYGQFGFHYMYGLVPFMQYCVNYNPTRYAVFNQYIALGVGNPQLANNTGLHNQFIYFATNYQNEFAYLQNAKFVEDYLNPVMARAGSMANLDNPFIRGALGSFAVRNGAEGTVTARALEVMQYSSDIQTQLRAGYTVFYDHYSYEGDRYIYEYNDVIADMATGSNVYDLSTLEIVVPPTPSPEKRKMPIWMMIRYR